MIMLITLKSHADAQLNVNCENYTLMAGETIAEQTQIRIVGDGQWTEIGACVNSNLTKSNCVSPFQHVFK